MVAGEDLAIIAGRTPRPRTGARGAVGIAVSTDRRKRPATVAHRPQQTWGELLRSLGAARVESPAVRWRKTCRDHRCARQSCRAHRAQRRQRRSPPATLAIDGGILTTDDKSRCGWPGDGGPDRNEGSVVTGLVDARENPRTDRTPVVVSGGWRSPRVARDGPPLPAAAANQVPAAGMRRERVAARLRYGTRNSTRRNPLMSPRPSSRPCSRPEPDGAALQPPGTRRPGEAAAVAGADHVQPRRRERRWRVDQNEMTAFNRAVFVAIDADGDSKLTAEEFRRVIAEAARVARFLAARQWQRVRPRAPVPSRSATARPRQMRWSGRTAGPARDARR